MNERRTKRPPHHGNNTITRPPYTWVCGDDSPQKHLLRKLLEHRHVIASFTQEEPKNSELLAGMLLPLVGDNDEIKIQNLGKSNSLRGDRKYSAVLPCCGKSIMSFDNVSNHGILEGIQLVLYPDSSGLTLYFDDDNVTDRFFSCSNRTEWECVFSDVYNVFLYWAVFEAPRNVSTITMCNHASTCGNATRDLSMQSLTIYGEG